MVLSQSPTRGLPALPARPAALLERVSREAAARHVLIIAHPGTAVTMVVRRLAAAWPAPTSPADRWVAGLAWHLTRGRHFPAGPHAPTDRAPFRAPHHTVSAAGLFGGGPRRSWRPGECTLAHGGILFLDEYPEFSRYADDGVRQVLTDREIHVYRGARSVAVPASFRLVASALPCPCGFQDHPHRACVCSAGVVARYRSRFAKLAARADVATIDATIGGLS